VLFCFLATNSCSFNSRLLGSIRKCDTNDPELAIQHRQEFENFGNAYRYSINSVASHNLTQSAYSPCYLSRVNSAASSKAACVGLGIHTRQESVYRSPPPTRLCAVAQKTLYEQTNMNVSSLSLKGFTPPPNFLNSPRVPPRAFLADSAFKAIHPPAYHFRHFPSPLRQEMSVRIVPPSPSGGVKAIQHSLSRTSTLTFLPLIPAGSERSSLQSPSDSTEEPNSRSTLSIATYTSTSPCATASTASKSSRIRYNRCSSDITIPSTLAERRESGESSLAEQRHKEFDRFNLRELDLVGCGRFYHTFEEMELDLPNPQFVNKEGSISSSLGYCGASELRLDRFPTRVDSLDNF